MVNFGKKAKGLSQRATDRVSKMAAKAAKKKLEGKSLDQLAAINMRFIGIVGQPEMRKRVLIGIEDEVRDLVKEGKTDDEILDPVKASPNYLKMLGKLDLSLIHIKEIIRQAREAAK